MLARILAIIGLPTWLGPVVLIGLAVSAVGGVYLKGRADANANCRAAELERELYAQAVTVSRYRSALEASEMQRQQEAKDATDREAALAERAAQLEAERVREAADDAALEAALDGAITDKDQLNAIITKLRSASRTNCRASDADVTLDRRMLKQGN